MKEFGTGMKDMIKMAIVSLMVLSCGSPDAILRDKAVREAVEVQMSKYPYSTLVDIYKSFFQDEYGPGHLLSDTAGAWGYYSYELEAMESRGRYEVEKCGAGKNFVRVPMDLVKDSRINEKAFFNAFLESSSLFSPPDMESWIDKWNGICSVVEQMELNIPGFEEDKSGINEMLQAGQAVVHHSTAYREHYDPHYRIMSVVQWKALNNSLK